MTLPTTEATPAPDTAAPTCAACSHAWDAHDVIGVRYCTATTAGGLSRGCVCRGGTRTD
jgi:hypothetical protein